MSKIVAWNGAVSHQLGKPHTWWLLYHELQGWDHADPSLCSLMTQVVPIYIYIYVFTWQCIWVEMHPHFSLFTISYHALLRTVFGFSCFCHCPKICAWVKLKLRLQPVKILRAHWQSSTVDEFPIYIYIYIYIYIIYIYIYILYYII